MLLRVLAMALSSLCLCLSVISRCCIARDEWINQVFGMKASFDQSMCFKETQLPTKIMVLPAGIFSYNSSI